MARQNHGPLSRAKGKLGGVVYQQYEGMQISREYQPVVKNPQTSKQTKNRAKFKLSSQLVAEFSDVINARLAKLAIYTRVRRGSALNAIYNAISGADPEAPAAIVADVVAAINSKSESSFVGPTVTYNQQNSQFSITATTGDIVVADVVEYATTGAFLKRQKITYTSDGTAKVSEAIAGETAAVMVVSLRATTGVGRATISNLSFDGSSWANIINRGVAAGDLMVSDITYAVKTA